MNCRTSLAIFKQATWLMGVCLLLAVAGTESAPAQPAAAVQAQQAQDARQNQQGGPPDKAEIEELVRTLEDPEARKKLVGQLRLLLEAQDEEEAEEPAGGLGSRVVLSVAREAKDIAEGLADATRSFRQIPAIYRQLMDQVRDPETRRAWLRLTFKLLAVAAIGLIANLIARMLLNRPRRIVEGRVTDSLWVRLPFLVLRTVLDVIPVIAFFGAALAALPVMEPAPLTRDVIVRLLNAYLIVGLVVVVARMILVPAVAGLRAVPLVDETANYLFIWVRRFAYLWVYGLFIADAARLMGFSAAGHRVLTSFIGLVVLAMGIMFVLQNRRHLADLLRREPSDGVPRGLSSLRNRFADIWHALAIIYLCAIYGIWVLRIAGGFEYILRASVLTLVILAAVQFLTVTLRRAVDRGFSLSAELRARYPTLEARANRYLPVLQTIIRWVLYLIAFLAILSAWGTDVLGWIESPSGRRVVSAAISIAIVLVLALVVWEGISSAIERYLNRPDHDGETARRARARTLLPLARNALLIVIVVMVALVVMSELGINIGPLLAGAGVVGLAIGFGSQKLVQDVITGAFILFEDSMAVGHVVRVAGIAGVVEALSIRSIRLRDLSGNVHTIPFSAVNEVTNMTKDFSYYLFEVGVAYRENVDEVMDVLRQLGEEIQADPEYGPKILEPLEIMGLDRFADSAVIVRARFKTLPIQQWYVGREFNRRIKARFDELGIEIPFPHTTLYFGENKDGSAPAAHIRAADERTRRAVEGEPPPDASRKPSESGQIDQNGGG